MLISWALLGKANHTTAWFHFTILRHKTAAIAYRPNFTLYSQS